MSSFKDNFVWYELLTSDAEAAEAFYRGTIGWGARDSGLPDRRYTILTLGDTPVAGLMTLPEEARKAGARPGWIGYVAVEDVDAVSARVKEAGGIIRRAPDDIPGIGRFAIVADPQGATFALFKGSGAEPHHPRPAPCTPGLPGWHELHAADRESAFAFYTGLFGWTKTDAVDLGPMGIYQLFTTGEAAGGVSVGGMMTKPEAMPAPCWLYYFNVEDIDAAAGRVTGSGGRILNGPHQVPGGSWIVQGLDPQGAMFALVGPRVNVGSQAV